MGETPQMLQLSRNLRNKDAKGKVHKARSQGQLSHWCTCGNSLLNGLLQLFSEYQPLLRHLICIIYHHYHHDFHQNTIYESCLTIVIVSMSFPKVKNAVLKNLLILAKNTCHKASVCFFFLQSQKFFCRFF